MIDWRIEARELANCNCVIGCPCQFNAPPSHGNCEAVVAFEIDRGHFGDVPLDGLCVVAINSWPGPIHAGHGKSQVVIDERATDQQRDALLKILSGQETEPGTTVFSVFAATFDEVLEPLFKPIAMDIDVDARRGSVRIDNLVHTTASPILNPITGKEHRARIDMPDGFEFRIAEVGRGTSEASGAVAMSLTDSHTHFARLKFTQHGVVE